MAGLNLGVGGQVQARTSGSSGSFQSYPGAQSATEAAFGPSMGESKSQGVTSLAPNNPAGIALWWSVASLAALVFMYWSLPA